MVGIAKSQAIGNFTHGFMCKIQSAYCFTYIQVLFPELRRSHSMILPEKLVQITGVYVSHPRSNLLDAHAGVYKHLLHLPQAVH